MDQKTKINRRNLLAWIAKLSFFSPLIAIAGVKRKSTPSVSLGPFYPPDPVGLPFYGAKPLSPLPKGNDLTSNSNGQRSEGEPVVVRGRVLKTSGEAVPGAMVELWQVDNRGHYAVETNANRDPGFKGYGTVLTDSNGYYEFKTIRPRGYKRYGGLIQRTAHIHVQVSSTSHPSLATEVWFAGELGNESDTFVRRIQDLEVRERMLVRFKPNESGIPVGVFDIVLPDA